MVLKAAGNVSAIHEEAAAVPPSASTFPSNTPLPTPEMIEVPEGATTPAAPKLQLALPRYVAPILPPPALSESELLLRPQVFVRKYIFEGNTVFSDATLAKVVEKYCNRDVTAEDLEEARQDLTLYYVNRGYVNSGAVLPDQDPKNGLILFKIVEGKLTKVDLKGNNWFQTWWLRNEIRQAAGTPLNFNNLKEGLQVLRENSMVAQINAELQPGGVPGEAILKTDVKDTHPFQASLEFSNDRPPSVGSEIVELHTADLNLTGNNDPLAVTYGIAQSNAQSVEFSDVKNIDGSYTFPVSPYHTTVELRGSRSDSSLIEAPFNSLNITSDLFEYGATIRQLAYETPRQELSFSLSGSYRHSETDLLGLPFTLTPGAINGVTNVVPLRFIQEFVDRSQVHVLSLRSAFSYGLNAFGATINSHSPDGRFFSWLGQSQYIRRLGASNLLLVLRLNAQLANGPLPSLEQFELGGSSSVRGYLENQALRDNGVFGSAELRIPVWADKNNNPLLALAPFCDLGVGWNNPTYAASTVGTFDSQAVGLPSVGVGLLFTPNRYVNGQLYFGYALNQEQLPNGTNLQNYGICFDLVVSAF